MGYLHINNLYKARDVLLFKEVYALEKVHGTSAHIKLADGALTFFPGGESRANFEALFDPVALLAGMGALGSPEVTVYGEAYGGKCQRMSHTYGDALRFIVFDVQIGDTWLDVPAMDRVATNLGLEVVPWTRVVADVEALNFQRDAPSIVAERRGCGVKPREGIVVRPLLEVSTGDGRVIAKHKGAAFEERATPPKADAGKLEVLAQATAIADEWVTPMRLSHVCDKLPANIGPECTKLVIDAMVEDVLREAAGEIVDSKEARSAIGKRTAQLFRARLAAALTQP